MQYNYAAALYEGTFSVGLDKKFNRIGRDDKPAKGALKISINPFLISQGRQYFLFDAGLGEFGKDTTCQVILDNLEKHGVDPFQISDIFLSHLHYDHMGGLAGKSGGYWELTFPDATIWVSKAAWQEATAREIFYDEQKTEFLHYIDAKAAIAFYEDGISGKDVSAETIGGHTRHHQVLRFDGGEKKYMMAGDVIATRGHINRTFAAKYDYDADQSIKMRNALVKQAYEDGYTFLGYHDNHHPIFKLTDYQPQKGYTIEIAETPETA